MSWKVWREVLKLPALVVAFSIPLHSVFLLVLTRKAELVVQIPITLSCSWYTGDSISWLLPRGDCGRAQAVGVLTLTVPVPCLSSSSFLSRRMYGLGIPFGMPSFNTNSPFVPSSNYSLANWKANCFVCMTWSKDHSEPPLSAMGHPRLCLNASGTENLASPSVFQDQQYQHYLGAHGKCRPSGLP